MANPLAFQPIPVDPRTELHRRLAEAPLQHGEALLVAWDLLETAHRQGLLDLLDGIAGAKDTILGTLTNYAKLPEGVASIRNLLAMVKILGALDPETLDGIARALDSATRQHQLERKPPSLWQIAKRTASADGRRGLSFMTLILTSVGRSLKQ